MPRFRSRLRLVFCLASVLLVGACSVGGVDYDPNRGLVLGDQSSDNAQTSDSSNNGLGGITLGELFGPSSSSSDGYVVGDEPYAVKAGARILAQGGSAADAATAIYFAMAVTYPGAAGLGGGGLCIVHDPATHRSRAITFLARNAAGGGAYAVPGNVRGFAALQKNYGVLPWSRDVSYAEALAATGFPISDALAARLKAAQNVIRLDAGLAAEFLDESGHVKAAGTVVSNPDLASTLAALRQHGPAAFYRDRLARDIVAYSAQQGGAISAADLDDIHAGLSAPQQMHLADQYVLLPPASVGAGSFAEAVLSRLVGADAGPVAGDPAQTTRQAVQAALRKFAVRNLPRDLGATGFAALDRKGEAVACAVTMNGPFGSGHTVPGTGITLANAPASGPAGLAAAFLTPVISLRDVTGPIRLPDEAPTLGVSLVGAGAGGPAGTEAIAYGVLRLALNKDITKPGDLRAAATTPYDTVNAIACQHGICAVLPDRRSHGLGAAAGE